MFNKKTAGLVQCEGLQWPWFPQIPVFH